MIICGLKLTHDGAVALIDDGKLIFSYEMEKLNNNLRYTDIKDFSVVDRILKENGYSLSGIDKLVIDGWGEIEKPQDFFRHTAKYGSGNISFDLAKYGHLVINQPVLDRCEFLSSDGRIAYSSYMHVSGHVLGAYCTSDYAQKREGSFVLVWDGGMTPQLFYVDPAKKQIENCRPLFLLNGNIYSFFAQRFPPFDKTKSGDISIAGKVMAYIALGKPSPGLLYEFNYAYRYTLDRKREHTSQVLDRFAALVAEQNCSPEDAMATFHVFIEELLVSSLKEKIGRFEGYKKNICLAGGCALNIKWNRAIQSGGIFESVWVPPFPNDAGSAIGTACCEMVVQEGWRPLDWEVYTGPAVADNFSSGNWVKYHYTIRQLAKLLYSTNQPVILLDGRAELGPRALGNRSIIATAVNASMKDRLNDMKNREGYRPVAPICLEDDAPGIFDPGLPDPYMLYDHFVRDEWINKIPAICHLDGSARLQTVNMRTNPRLYLLLQEYKALSGIPVLCNTSANFNGKGFFPDVDSAIKWNKANFVWSSGFLFARKGYEQMAGENLQAVGANVPQDAGVEVNDLIL